MSKKWEIHGHSHETGKKSESSKNFSGKAVKMSR